MLDFFFILQVLSKKVLFGWWYLSCRAVWSGSHCTAQGGLKLSDFLLLPMLGLQAEARSCPQAFFAPTVCAEAPALPSSQLSKQIGGVLFSTDSSSPRGNSKKELKAVDCVAAGARSLCSKYCFHLLSARQITELNKHSKAENNSEHLLHQGFSNKRPLYVTQYGNQITMNLQVFWWPL